MQVMHASGGMSHVHLSSRLRALELQSYRGDRDAKLENSLLKQYFIATRPELEDSKVSLATMNLVDDAKLWWCTRWEEMQQGHNNINTWEALKTKLQTQFMLENTEFVAWRKLQQLCQTSAIRDYVKQYFALMLDIQDM